MARSVAFEPCIKCGGEDLDYGDCGYSTFNVAWTRCKGCGREVEISPCFRDIKTSAIARVWNKQNDIGILITGLEKQAAEIKTKLSEYKNIRRKSKRKKVYA